MRIAISALLICLLTACCTEVQKQKPDTVKQQQDGVATPQSASAGKPDKQPDSEPAKNYYDPYSDRLYRAYLIATVVGVLGGIAVLTVLILQTGATRKAAEAAKEGAEAATKNAQSAEKQIAALREQVEQMKIASDAASRSADAILAAERAWLMVDITWQPLHANVFHNEVIEQGVLSCTTTANLRCVCTNDGKTPAWIDELRCCLLYVDAVPLVPPLGLMEPMSVAPEPVGAGEQSEPRDFCAEAQGPGKLGQLLILCGIVMYRDIFQKERTTTFGYIIRTGGKIGRIAGYYEYNKNT